MGRSITPTFIVRYREGQRINSFIWNTKQNGRPTIKNLMKWRQAMNNSFKVGGVNEHASRSLGYILHISNCEIYNQKTGEVVVSYQAPVFEQI